MKNILGKTFGDISLLYKNFFHWNVSKILFSLYGVLLSIILVVPFVIIYYIYIKIFGGNFMDLFYGITDGKLLSDTFGNIIYFIIIFLTAIGFSFLYFLLGKLYNTYIDGKKVKFFQNGFLSVKLIVKYVVLSILIFILSVVIPFIIFVLLFSLLIIGVGGITPATELSLSGAINFFTIASFAVFVFMIFLVFYLFYRFVFSYFSLLDEKKSEKIGYITLLKNSFKKTKGIKKLYKFLLVVLCAFIVYSPFYLVGAYLSTSYNQLRNYAVYQNFDEESKALSRTMNPYYIDSLELTYGGISVEEIMNMQNRYYLRNRIFQIINFLCVTGIYVMALASYNKRVLDKK